MSNTDGNLLGQCRKGDETAWRELVERHARRVFGVAYRFTGRVDEAEDLTQEIFVKVYETLDRFRQGPVGHPVDAQAAILFADLRKVKAAARTGGGDVFDGPRHDLPPPQERRQALGPHLPRQGGHEAPCRDPHG